MWCSLIKFFKLINHLHKSFMHEEKIIRDISTTLPKVKNVDNGVHPRRATSLGPTIHQTYSLDFLVEANPSFRKRKTSHIKR